MERKIIFTNDDNKPFSKWVKKNYGYTVGGGMWEHSLQYSLRLEILKRYVWETRGVLISVYNNASGFLWSMMKTDSGTDLGWCEHTGTNHGGAWDDYYECLQDALILDLCSGGLKKFGKSKAHWSHYASWAQARRDKYPHPNDLLNMYRNAKL